MAYYVNSKDVLAQSTDILNMIFKKKKNYFTHEHIFAKINRHFPQINLIF